MSTFQLTYFVFSISCCSNISVSVTVSSSLCHCDGLSLVVGLDDSSLAALFALSYFKQKRWSSLVLFPQSC